MTIAPLPRSLAIAAALLSAIAASAARAAESRSVSGHALSLTIAGSADVRVVTDPARHDGATVTGDGSLDCAVMNGDGGGASIVLPPCLNGVDHLTVLVPPNIPLSLTHTGSGDVTVSTQSAPAGPLNLTQTGDGDLAINATTVLNATVGGSGDLRIGRVDGPARITIGGSGDVALGSITGVLDMRGSGSGNIVIGSADLGEATIDLAGSGDAMIGGGSVGHLRATTAGSGDIVVGATVHSGDVRASADGDIRIARPDGPINHSSSGGGSVTLGGGDLVNSALAHVGQVLSSRGFQAAMEKVGDVDESRHHHRESFTITTGSGSGGGSGVGYWIGHVVAGLIVAGLALALFSIVRRRGGPGARAARGASAAATPTRPELLALGESMTRLERRLGQVETYVTSREFELQRKFRELDAGGPATR